MVFALDTSFSWYDELRAALHRRHTCLTPNNTSPHLRVGQEDPLLPNAHKVIAFQEYGTMDSRDRHGNDGEGRGECNNTSPHLRARHGDPLLPNTYKEIALE